MSRDEFAAASTLRCSVCGEEPGWSFPREGDPCWNDDGGKLVRAEQPAATLAEKQQAEGWYCYGCARWLPAGTGSVRQERHKAYSGLYCKGGCDV